MKKFAYVFIIIYGFIVTFGIFNEFNERYFNSLDNTILEYHDWTDKNGVIINPGLFNKAVDIMIFSFQTTLHGIHTAQQTTNI